MKNGEAEWKMPKVELGQTVLWNWNRAGTMASTGVVVGVGDKTINVALHTTATKDHTFRTGVHHKDDPWLLQNPNHDGGVWSLTPRDIVIDEMIAALMPRKIERGPATPVVGAAR